MIITARLLPQDARFVDQPAKDHRRRDGTKHAHLNPLYPQRERALIVVHAPERRRQGRHRRQEGEKHHQKAKHHKDPQMVALRLAHRVDGIVAATTVQRTLLAVERRVDARAVPVHFGVLEIDLLAATGVARGVVHDAVRSTDRFVVPSAAGTAVVARVV